jgi:hypothetical protein
VTALISRRSFLASLAALPLAGRAAEVEGLTLPDDARVAPGVPSLRLVGAGTFSFFFRRYYVCALYAQTGLRGAQPILAADAPRRVALFALRRIASWEFLWGLDRGLADNTGEAELRALAPQLDSLRAVVREIGAIADRSRVAIDYVPAQGTRISVDAQSHGAWIAGKALNDALVRVWIGARPLDVNLKEALVG